MKRGDITGMSFAFEDDYEDTENGVSYERTNDVEDGKEVWLRHVKKITGLYDVAIVTHPAYEQTTVGLREASEAIDKAIEAQLKRECGGDDEAKKKAEEEAAKRAAEEEAKKKAEQEAREQAEREAEEEQRERERMAAQRRHQRNRARRINSELLESLEY